MVWRKKKKEFRELKEKIEKLPSLTIYDLKKSKKLKTDAFNYRLGRVFYQVKKEEWKLLGFISNTISNKKTRWLTHNKEIFALMTALQK